MHKYEVWREGYRATGEEGYASFIGSVYADSFKEACDILCANRDDKIYGRYDSEKLMVWACRLFDNEEDAKRSFG